MFSLMTSPLNMPNFKYSFIEIPKAIIVIAWLVVINNKCGLINNKTISVLLFWIPANPHNSPYFLFCERGVWWGKWPCNFNLYHYTRQEGSYMWKEVAHTLSPRRRHSHELTMCVKTHVTIQGCQNICLQKFTSSSFCTQWVHALSREAWNLLLFIEL